jgi:hypothetical protein
MGIYLCRSNEICGRLCVVNLEGSGEDGAIAYFIVLLWHLPEKYEEDHENFRQHSQCPI